MIIQRKQIIDELVKRPLIVIPAKAGVQFNGWIPVSPGTLDSGFRQNDGKPLFAAYESINIVPF